MPITKEKLIAYAIRKTRVDLILGASTHRDDVDRTGGFSMRNICFVRHKIKYHKSIIDDEFCSAFYGRRNVGSMIQIQMAFYSALARYNRGGNCYEMAAVCAMYLCGVAKEYESVEISIAAFSHPIDHAFVKIKIDNSTFICDPWSEFYFDINDSAQAKKYLEKTLALLGEEDYLEEILSNIDNSTDRIYLTLSNPIDCATYANLCALFYQRELAENNEHNPNKDISIKAIDLNLGILPDPWKRKMKMRQIARFTKMRNLMESNAEYFSEIYSSDYDLPQYTLHFFRRYTVNPGPLFALTDFQVANNLSNEECNKEAQDALSYVLKANEMPPLEEQFLEYERRMDMASKAAEEKRAKSNRLTN